MLRSHSAFKVELIINTPWIVVCCVLPSDIDFVAMSLFTLPIHSPLYDASLKVEKEMNVHPKRVQRFLRHNTSSRFSPFSRQLKKGPYSLQLCNVFFVS